jgi:hypothetical protein
MCGFGGASQVLGAIVPGELFPNKYRYLVWMCASTGLFPLVAIGTWNLYVLLVIRNSLWTDLIFAQLQQENYA